MNERERQEIGEEAVEAIIEWIIDKHGEWGDFVLGRYPDIRDVWRAVVRERLAAKSYNA